MNMFARFDENPAMTLRVIKETKRYGRTDGQRENSIPPTNKVCGGYKNSSTKSHCISLLFSHCNNSFKLEDLKVLRRSPDLLNNVKLVQGQLQLIMKQMLFYHLYGLQPFWSSDLNNPMNTPSNSPVISEENMFK